MKKTLLTEAALDKLNQDYEALIEKRRIIAEELKRARDFGDLSENAEYHAAREAQSHNETELQKLREIFENYELVEVSDKKKVVSIGSRVRIEYLDEKEIDEVTIVTKVDSDPLKGLISNESPVGMALLGKKKGAKVEVESPGGLINIKILELIKAN
ncbi:MAG: transcription elongation factor GreA [Bacillota bacterium]|nr:transcription elongation factor GreA [Bacillota bacterium]